MIRRRAMMGRSAAGWTPADYQHQLYIDDESAVTLDANSKVMQIDSITSVNHAVQNDALYRPTVIANDINGYRSINCDNKYLEALNQNNFNFVDNFAIHMVVFFRSTSLAWRKSMVSRQASDGTGWRLDPHNNIDTPTMKLAGISGDQSPQGNNLPFADAWHIVSMKYDGVNHRVEVDGNLNYEVLTSGDVQDDATPVLISGNNAMGLDTADLKFAAGVVTDIIADFDKHVGYFAHKYGLAANLPASHPYKNSAP